VTPEAEVPAAAREEEAWAGVAPARCLEPFTAPHQPGLGLRLLFSLFGHPQNLHHRWRGENFAEGPHPLGCLLIAADSALAGLVKLVVASQIDLELQRSAA